MAQPKPIFQAELEAEAQAWWSKHYGTQDKLDCDRFAEALLPAIEPIDMVLLQKVSKCVIDCSQDGKVDLNEWTLFVARFGPLKTSVKKCVANLFDRSGVLAPYYHGAETRKEAELTLDEDGKFLLRFSERFPAKFTLAYSKRAQSGPISIKNVLVQNHPKGYALEVDNAEHVLPSLNDIIHAQPAHKIAVSKLYKRLANEGVFPPPDKFEMSHYSSFVDDHKYDSLGALSSAAKGPYNSLDEVQQHHASSHANSGHVYSPFNVDPESYTDLSQGTGKSPRGGPTKNYQAFDEVADGGATALPGSSAPKAQGHYSPIE